MVATIDFHPYRGLMMRVRNCRTLCLIAVVTMAPVAMAQKDDSHGNQLAAHGLGHSSPSARNLSLDASWNVYGFERDGISYYQVNDLAGSVQIIVGRASETFWTLPAGVASSRISLPSQPLTLPKGVSPSMIYQAADFSIVHYPAERGGLWAVEFSGVLN